MQSKGAIRLVAILLAIACIWQLSFTAVSALQEKKAENYAAKAVESFQNSAAFGKIAEANQAYTLDSLSKAKNRFYIDSVSAEKVYFGYTYKDVKSKEINLGLDLKGGMNVMLQVQLEDLVKALAGNNETQEFNDAIALAKKNSTNSRQDFISLFADAWKEVGNGKRLSSVFGTYDMKDRIRPESTDEQVITVIREDAEAAVANSFNVLRNRIDRFGVTQPSIQRLGSSGRILVELPGVKEPERVRKLLQGTASLEFWTTFTRSELQTYLADADALVAKLVAEEKGAEAPAEETVAEPVAAADSSSVLSEELSQQEVDAKAEWEKYQKEHPLSAALNLGALDNVISSATACIGVAQGADTALVNKYLAMPQVRDIFPAEFRPMWSVKPSDFFPGANLYELVAIKASTFEGKAPLDGGAVSDARVAYEGQGRNQGSPSVSMTMNAQGANTWAALTKANVGRQIAIVLDGMVYSYPTVQNEITGGNSSITGNFDIEEATDLTNVLKSGKLPAPAKIIQEEIVGPSLGAKSIQAGMISFLIAFLLVLIYMVIFYRGAGIAADVALLCNVLFLFGILTSFGAVLTLPGIAGLVLTLGMAVDANVIIYERIKEELAAGKGLGKAVSDGYKNAYSAIIDGQVTTLLTGFVLFSFGSGPVQGFATTLIIGIITSIITSIFITRLIFERKISRGKKISFETEFSRNFLKHTKIDFLGKKKFSYSISGIVLVIAIASILFKGFTFGVDFQGGRTYVIRFDQPQVAEQVRAAVQQEFANDPEGSSVEVKQFGGATQMKVTTTYKVKEEASEVDKEIEGKLYNATKQFFAEELSLDDFTSSQTVENGIISSEKVGPTIANDMKRDAIIAVIIALIVIFGYIAIRFRGWTWGLGGVVSLAHTAIIIIGFFSLFTGILPFNLDVDQTFIAAILTIIGYAINDNVVIFDRIREMKGLHPNQDFKETVNSALNATLTRTVNTSVSTLLPMLAIAIFGGESIRGLSVALCLGIIIGTYASIFIGTPVMFDATKKADAKTGKKK
ncbi:MAG: protein translocase subunit SecDF [Bacteroidales bacterium]|nr:protein translocase subunit SecDF [Bacteroidales bacterium]